MDHNRLAELTRLMTHGPSRRDVLRGLTAARLGLGPVRFPDLVEAKKKRRKGKKKPKKAKPNAFGCLDVGQACNGNSSACCSGICEGTTPRKGKKDTSRCVAHDADICTPGSNACLFEGVVSCGSSDANCYCLRTTGNAPFCGNTGSLDVLALLCRDCSQDTDCHEEFGPAAACVDLREGICQSVCPSTGGTACVPACPDADM